MKITVEQNDITYSVSTNYEDVTWMKALSLFLGLLRSVGYVIAGASGDVTIEEIDSCV